MENEINKKEKNAIKNKDQNLSFLLSEEKFKNYDYENYDI